MDHNLWRTRVAIVYSDLFVGVRDFRGGEQRSECSEDRCRDVRAVFNENVI